MILQGDSSILATNLFAYCFNNPIMYADHSGMVVTPANVIGAVIGGIIGAVGGYFLSRFLADKIGLSGWKRTVFVVGITAIISASAAVIGYFLGPYIAKAGKAAINSIKNFFVKSLCFVEGTPVLTDKGNIPIEQIKEGDYVYAEIPETGEKGLRRVLETFVNESYELVHVTINGETIVTTPGHPFYLPEKGWVGAGEFEAGDTLLLSNGEHVIVEKVQYEKLSTPVKVYNFEVEDFHTYYVGENSVLTHNTGCSWNSVTDHLLKKNNLDAHAIKREYMGQKAQVKLYDLVYDKSSGVVAIILKATKEVLEITTYKIDVR